MIIQKKSHVPQVSSKLSVLVIEDSAEDAEKNISYLQHAGYEVYSKRVETEKEMRSAMEKEKWDIILADYLMPRFSVPAALQIYKESGSDIPFIVISGAIGDKKAVSMMKAGAHDYFMKDNMTRFVSAVERELREAAIREEKKWANQNLLIQHNLSLKLNKTSDLKVAMDYVMDTFLKVEGIDCISIYLFNKLRGELELSASDGMSQEVLKRTLLFTADTGFTKLVMDGRPVYGSFREINPEIKLFNDDAGFRAVAILPVELDGHYLGAVFCASYTADEFLFGTKLTLESIALLIGETISRIHSEAVAKKNEFNYRLLAENATDVIWMIGLDMKPVFFSPSIFRLLGYTVEEAMINKMDQVYTPSSLEYAMKTLEEELIHDTEREPQRSRMMELELIRKDGSIVTVEANFTFLRNEQGLPAGIMTIARDITQRKLWMEAHQKSERELKAIMNSCSEVIFLVDRKGTILTCNEGLGIRLGMDPESLPGKNIADILPPEVVKRRKRKIDAVFSTGEPVRFEDERSGHYIINSIYPIVSASGEITSAAVFGLEITERVMAERKLIHAGRMAGLGELASGIAHEINQPLNTISMIVDNLVSEVARKENIEEGYLRNKSEKIFANITRMRNIIDHIRAFSRNQDDDIVCGFDINSSIRNAVSMISEQFNHLGIQLNLDLDSTLPETTGNTYKFEQVVLNLLANAKDAVLEKSNKVTKSQSHKVNVRFEMMVGIRSYQKDQNIVVEVSDNGIGISNENLDRIMLPFYTTKESGKGTGLGLSISYQIINEMNGTLEITSNMLQGTTIKIILTTK
jgi:PAS domain S-box-containing protein